MNPYKHDKCQSHRILRYFYDTNKTSPFPATIRVGNDEVLLYIAYVVCVL